MFANLSASRKILVSFASIAGLSILVCGLISILILRMAASADNVGSRLAPLADAAMEIQLHGANAHLVMEEIMGGDAAEDVSEVIASLDEARFFAQAILDGGENDEGTFYPSDNEMVRERIGLVVKDLDAFEAAAEERFKLVEQNSGVGSEADAQFDALYDELVARISDASKQMRTAELQRLAGDARYLLAHGHLLVAEILGGDTGEDFGEATDSFEAAIDRLQQASVQFPEFSPAATPIMTDIEILRDLAVTRYDRMQAKARAIEQAEIAFDGMYETFVREADEAETEIQNAIAAGLAEQKWISTKAEMIAGAGALLLLLMLGGMYRWLDATLGRRMSVIANAMESITTGDLDNMPPDWKTSDEIGLLRSKLDELRTVFIRQKELEASAAADRDIAQKGQAEAEAMRQAADKDRAAAEQSRQEAELRAEAAAIFGKEFSRVVEAARVGDLSVRVQANTGQTDLDRLGDALNELLGTLDTNLQAAMTVLAAVSNGDLRHRMEGQNSGVFAELQKNTNNMINALQLLVGEISNSGVNLASSSDELRDTSETLSKQAEQNAASLEETSAALEELSSSVRHVSENVSDANENARVASQTAKNSGVVAAAAADAMNRIAESSKEISKVVAVINEISFQISLLALNAGVEAARAGDAGRGFSVVASEVRALAQRASEAAKEIDGVIAQSDEAVSEGVVKVADARSSLDKISESVVGISSRIDEVAAAIAEQVSGLAEISSAMSQLDQSTQRQVASFEEVTTASSVLSNEAGGLKAATARFKTGKEPVGAGTARTGKVKESRVIALDKTPPAPSELRKSPPPQLSGNLAVDHGDWDEF